MPSRRRKQPVIERLVRRIFYKYYARNLLYELQIRARAEAADYVQGNMCNAVILEDPVELYRFAVGRAESQGLFLEFGVAGGDSINVIAGLVDGQVHGFDSFNGLPEDWRGHVEVHSAFSRNGKSPPVARNVTLHTGPFVETIPEFKRRHNAAVSLLHIDCDLYNSTRDVLRGLEDRIRPGTIILFDEYFNYPGWKQHEFKAWQEFVAEHKVSYDYLAISAREGKVVVRVTSIG